MPRKITLYRATFTPVACAIPDKCPKCGANTHPAGAMRAAEWEVSMLTVEKIVRGGVEPCDSERSDEASYTSEVSCRCGYVLASAEE